MTYEEYAELEGVNWSKLKHMGTSPAHYLAAGQQGAPTEAMLGGTLLHDLVLEPDKDPTVPVWHGGSRTTKTGKEEWADFCEAHGYARDSRVSDVPHINWGIADNIRRAADAVLAHPAAREVLDGAQTEVSMQWERGGVRCKGRADILPAVGGVWDLKSCISAGEREFLSQAAKLDYFGQLAHYAYSVAPGPCGFIAIEKTAPYDVGVFEIDAATMMAARDRVDAYIERLAECRRTGVWPGRHPERVIVSAPAWYLPEFDFNFEGV